MGSKSSNMQERKYVLLITPFFYSVSILYPWAISKRKYSCQNEFSCDTLVTWKKIQTWKEEFVFEQTGEFLASINYNSVIWKLARFNFWGGQNSPTCKTEKYVFLSHPSFHNPGCLDVPKSNVHPKFRQKMHFYSHLESNLHTNLHLHKTIGREPI